jgi:hypothetical protein
MDNKKVWPMDRSSQLELLLKAANEMDYGHIDTCSRAQYRSRPCDCGTNEVKNIADEIMETPE